MILCYTLRVLAISDQTIKVNFALINDTINKKPENISILLEIFFKGLNVILYIFDKNDDEAIWPQTHTFSVIF